jgi:hypothetical protein
VVILVRDFNPGTPAPRHASAEDESGRGLMLVEAISDRSGWYQPEDGTPGKVVWALVRADLQPTRPPALSPLATYEAAAQVAHVVEGPHLRERAVGGECPGRVLLPAGLLPWCAALEG